MKLESKLETRICSCGCGHSFRCLPSSGTRYASRNCMEVAGVLPPVEKFGRAGKIARPVKAEPAESEVPLVLDEDEALEAGHHKEAGSKVAEMALT